MIIKQKQNGSEHNVTIYIARMNKSIEKKNHVKQVIINMFVSVMSGETLTGWIIIFVCVESL